MRGLFETFTKKKILKLLKLASSTSHAMSFKKFAWHGFDFNVNDRTKKLFMR